MREYRSRFASSYDSVGAARRDLVHFAADHGFVDGTLYDIESAVGEALANAAEHGHCDEGAIDVRAYVEQRALVIEIEDRGKGFTRRAAPEHAPPLATSTRGFGLFLMRELMDHVEFDARGSRVKLVKRLP